MFDFFSICIYKVCFLSDNALSGLLDGGLFDANNQSSVMGDACIRLGLGD